jgi:hypothetical protein
MPMELTRQRIVFLTETRIVKAKRAGRSLLLFFSFVVLPLPGGAQTDDVAYCRQLAGLAMRYTGSSGSLGNLSPDLDTRTAVADCNNGNTAAGIALLERKLRSNGFTLPKR